MKTIVLFFLFFAVQASATTYYFSTTDGDDSRTATQAQNSSTPWKTLTKASSLTLAAGDRLLFKCGNVFFGTLKINNSGTAASPITIGAYGAGARPVFTGLVAVSNWTNASGNIWESNIISEAPTAFRPTVVMVNGVLTPIGRYPNANAANKGYLTYESVSGNTSISDNELSGTPNWTGAEVVIRKSHYVIDVGKITTHSGNMLSYTGTSDNNPTPGYGYFIQNDIRTLDQQNEWYFDAAAKKLKMYATTAPAAVKVAVQKSLIDATAGIRHYITIDGLALQGSYGAAIAFAGSAAGVTIQNCDLSNIGGFGIHINNCINAVVKQNTLTNILCGGIASSGNGTGNYVGYNTLKNIEYVPGAGPNGAGLSAINNSGANTVTEYNTVTNCAYIAIKPGGTNSHTRYNVLDFFCMWKDDGGAIYRRSGISGQSNIRIYNNIIRNGGICKEGTNSPNSLTEGIYCDDYENGILVYNNTLYNLPHSAIYLHNTTNIKVSGNTIYNCPLGFRVRGATDFTFTGGNVVFSKTTTDYLMHLYTSSGDIGGMGTIDSNYLYQPFLSTGLLRAENPNGKNYSFLNWRTSYPVFDAHSLFNATAIADTSLIRFETNETASPRSLSLGSTVYKDAKNNSYNGGSVTLAPYSSIVLINTRVGAVNGLPTALAGPDQTITLPVDSVLLKGAGTDPDGDPVTYAWTLTGGNPATIDSPKAATTGITCVTPGTYTFRLTVADGKGGTASDDVKITVVAPAPKSLTSTSQAALKPDTTASN